MRSAILTTAAVLAICPPAWSQDADSPATPQSPPGPVASSPAAPLSRPAARLTLPKNTPVTLELTDKVGSKASLVGDRFGLRLRDPIIVDGQVVVPAGVTGVGEVIHVSKAGFGGRPGEILVAARYLEWGSIRLPLRSMRIGVSGEDRTGEAVAAGMVLLPLAFVIPGGDIEVPAGTPAAARLAADVSLEVAPSPPPQLPPSHPEPSPAAAQEPPR